VEHGIRCVKLDPIVVLMTMGMVTRHLGLGATCSTTYYEPFHVARLFATLDLMTGGRAAWNVVTSLNDGEALNMGRTEVMEHDLRYDRADEFMEVVLGHCAAWTMSASTTPRAARSQSRARRRGIQWSSRPARAAAADGSLAAGVK
jgi:alkanesulfonate monooxygenase SsuD/methylene tetrahydromethanopterin reductase-like flavin-dependent oxidoreductase (luciferase family)